MFNIKKNNINNSFGEINHFHTVYVIHFLTIVHENVEKRLLGVEFIFILS